MVDAQPSTAGWETVTKAWWEQPVRWFLTQPPGRLFHGVVALACALVIWGHSSPYREAFLSSTFLVFATVLWLVRAAGCAVARWRGAAVAPARRFVVFPVAIALLLGLLALDAPLKVRWAASKSAFAGAVDDIPSRSASDPITINRRLGLYRVETAYRSGGMVVFTLPPGFFSEEEFIYSPDGPPSVGGVDPVPLGQGWYAWYWAD